METLEDVKAWSEKNGGEPALRAGLAKNIFGEKNRPLVVTYLDQLDNGKANALSERQVSADERAAAAAEVSASAAKISARYATYAAVIAVVALIISIAK